MVGLTLDQSDATLELGYYLARSHWGCGIATEAGAAITAYGLGLAGPGRIVAGYHDDNPASGRVLAKLGFVAVGTGERHCLATGTSHRSIELRR